MLGRKKYYSLDKILKHKAMYNVIFGERSNGKTYAVLEYALKRYIKNGSQLAIVRRWQDDFRGKRGAMMCESLSCNGHGDNMVDLLTGGVWNSIYYYSSRWYLAAVDDEGKRVLDERPFAFAFAISSMEHDKSTSYPGIKTVLFDEFLTRGSYLPDEFIIFMNILSTIIRDRDDVTIFMCGNTINKYCPYFKEMGLSNVPNMEQGTVDIYQYGNSGLTVAVEFSDSPDRSGKKSNKYFAFDNPKLNMITGSGNVWEIAVHPHCPVKYKPKDILFTYFVSFDGNLLQCEVVEVEQMLFTFVHLKTTPLKDITKDLIYSPDYSPLPNWKRRINKPDDMVSKKVAGFFFREKVFYQDNEVGEIMRNYLLWCGAAPVKGV